MSADITVIHIGGFTADCRRCGEETSDKWCWPFYEGFIINEGRWWQKPGGYVSVCACCY